MDDGKITSPKELFYKSLLITILLFVTSSILCYIIYLLLYIILAPIMAKSFAVYNIFPFINLPGKINSETSDEISMNIMVISLAIFLIVFVISFVCLMINLVRYINHTLIKRNDEISK